MSQQIAEFCFREEISKADLADMLGVHPSSLSRSMARGDAEFIDRVAEQLEVEVMDFDQYIVERAAEMAASDKRIVNVLRALMRVDENTREAWYKASEKVLRR